MGARKEKYQAVILAEFVHSLVLQDDPEQGCAVLHQVIDLVELTGSAAGKRRAFAAGRQSPPGATRRSSKTCRIGRWHLPAEVLSRESC